MVKFTMEEEASRQEICQSRKALRIIKNADRLIYEHVALVRSKCKKGYWTPLVDAVEKTAELCGLSSRTVLRIYYRFKPVKD